MPVVSVPDVLHHRAVHALSHATAVVQEIPAKREGVRTYYRLNYDLMVDALWIVTLIVIILVEDGPLLFS